MTDTIMLEDLETGMNIKHHLGDSHEDSREIVKRHRFEVSDKNVKKHHYSFGMRIHPSPVRELISTIEKGKGHYSINVYSTPDFGDIEIYNSHYDLGLTTPLEKQKEKTEKIYCGLIKILREEKFNLHIVPGPVSEPGELNSSKIFLEEIK